MTTRLSRESAASGRERALGVAPTRNSSVAPVASADESRPAPGALDILAAPSTSLATPATRANAPRRRELSTRVSRLRARRARVARWRRTSAALGAVMFAGLGSVTLASSSAVATTNPEPNSVQAFGDAPQLGSSSGLALRAGVIGIAGNPKSHGYWLVAADGGVFAFGDANFYGSTGDQRLNAPIVGMASTPDGHGYWLVAADGGVFAFGNASYEGSLAGVPLAAPITAIVPTTDGGGYWMVGADGGIFAFGDANFHGTQLDSQNPVVGIAASPTGDGYWVARTDGSVTGFGTAATGNASTVDAATAHPNTVGIAASAGGGYWIAEGSVAATSTVAADPFLACTRGHESDRAGGYQAVSPGGKYRGAYQFDQGTWNAAAQLAGRADLVGADPASVAPGDQDLLAISLFHVRGAAPWGNRCRGLS